MVGALRADVATANSWAIQNFTRVIDIRLPLVFRSLVLRPWLTYIRLTCSQAAVPRAVSREQSAR
jgi:hypothetical protein